MPESTCSSKICGWVDSLSNQAFARFWAFFDALRECGGESKVGGPLVTVHGDGLQSMWVDLGEKGPHGSVFHYVSGDQTILLLDFQDHNEGELPDTAIASARAQMVWCKSHGNRADQIPHGLKPN